MGEIKSSWEIALERTANIKSDKSSVHVNELKKSGQRIASEYIDAVSPNKDELAKAVKKYSREEKHLVEKAVLEILLSHITLPKEEGFEDSLRILIEGLQVILGDKRIIKDVSTQLSQFFTQFLEHREQFTEQIKQQYTPQLQQKQEALKKQYGYEVDLKPEQDPEFLSLLRKNIQKLEAQYQEALNQMKDQIRNYYGS